ncbi:MAG: IS110 family transposase [Leptolyngbyaceae cyanobacterium SM1_4_3]|nr:IS110 family transposase [Leptolyngbyaceae cyanobacterium SM1_4_3]
MKILAIDLGKFNCVSCLFDTETNTTEFETIKTYRIEFEGLLNRMQPQLVVMETCSITGWVHDLCVEQGYEVLVADPFQEAWGWKNVKGKTDKDDALKLAKLAALGQINPVYVPTPESRQYRQLVKYRKTVVHRVNRIQNNVRALFDQQGVKIPSGHRTWTVAGIEELSQHRKPLSECDLSNLWRGELDLELTMLDHLWEHLASIERQLEELAKSEERVQLLQTIPGVGRKTAEVIVVCLDDPKRFENARQVSAYAGLIPQQHQSGQTNRLGKITKRGSRLLRTALVEAAWAMLRYNEWAAATYARICGGQKTRKKTAITALARKLLVRCWAMLRHNQPWNPELAQPTASTC